MFNAKDGELGMSENELEGKVALVTGGSRGIGRAICQRLASDGAKVAVNYQNNKDAADATRSDIRALGSEGVTVQADVGKPEEVSRMVRETESSLGPIDFLVTNAGVAEIEPPSEMDFQFLQTHDGSKRGRDVSSSDRGW